MPLLAGGFRGVADGFVEGEEERDVVAEVGGGRGEVGEEGGGVELVEGVEEGSALLLVVLWGGGGRGLTSPPSSMLAGGTRLLQRGRG